MPYRYIMSDEDSRNKVGNAGSICCSGRHKGSIATRVLSNHWRTDKYTKFKLCITLEGEKKCKKAKQIGL